MTYALLIYRSTALGDEEGLDERTVLAGHRALQADAAARRQLHAVARLGGKEEARTVRRSGGVHEVTDGPYVDTKEWLVGFYLVDCESEEEALSRARLISPDRAHAIEIRPVTWRWKP